MQRVLEAWTGDYAPSWNDAKMSGYAFGERIATKDLDSKTAEVVFRSALMDRFSVFRIAAIGRVT